MFTDFNIWYGKNIPRIYCGLLKVKKILMLKEVSSDIYGECGMDYCEGHKWFKKFHVTTDFDRTRIVDNYQIQIQKTL